MRELKKIAIVGVGLIGGSLGLAIKRLPQQYEIVGIGRNSAALDLAKDRGAVDSISLSLTAVSDADLIFIATPVSQIVPVARELAGIAKAGAIITDVGSTKARIVQEIDSFFDKKLHYIGGHPMAGSESQGVTAATADLFVNSHYLLTPTAATDSRAFERLHQMLSAIGAHVMAIAPDKHDRLVASISHLPHLVASALVSVANRQATEEQNLLLLAAGGFRDTTRIAAADPRIWVDICLDNRQAILEVLRKYKGELDVMTKALERADRGALFELLAKARRFRQSLPSALEIDLSDLRELFIPVTDHPGVLSDITLIIGNLGINIEDIEILHATGLSGLMRVTVVGEDNSRRAVEALSGKGYPVEVRQVSDDDKGGDDATDGN